MQREAAETLALQALGWLLEDPDGFDRFLSLSGATQEDLRERAGDPEFLAAVMDFVLSDENLARGFCESASLDPQKLHAIRHALPGASVD